MIGKVGAGKVGVTHPKLKGLGRVVVEDEGPRARRHDADSKPMPMSMELPTHWNPPLPDWPAASSCSSMSFTPALSLIQSSSMAVATNDPRTTKAGSWTKLVAANSEVRGRIS